MNANNTSPPAKLEAQLGFDFAPPAAARRPAQTAVHHRGTEVKDLARSASATVRRPKRTAPTKKVPLRRSNGPARKRIPTKARSTTTSEPVTAERMAAQQREISVSEFFAKNRHLLGFDNKRKALLATVKEAVDNSLDACEEARILPELFVEVSPTTGERFRVIVRDNGPGIVKNQIPNIFGKLLYGSKFHRLKMCRGQQGIGISAAGMYGLITTGKPISIISRTSPRKKAHHYKLAIDTKKNRPDIVHDDEVDVDWRNGTQVEIELVASYNKGRQSIDEYMDQTAIANPHAAIHYVNPLGERSEFARATDRLPVETREIKPHPHGIELGTLMKMLKETHAKKVGAFLQRDFSRVSPTVCKKVCAEAGITPLTWVKQIDSHAAEAIYQALQNARIMAPSTDCLSPIGSEQILAGLLKGTKAEFYTASMRPPTVYRGNPFQVEVGLAYGGDLPQEELARLIRFANRVPLLYQQSHCAIYKSVLETKWRGYGLQQGRGALPSAPLVIMVHFASVWVPFTSESKEAIADYDEIRKETGLALRECGRKLQAYLRRRHRVQREGERRSVFLRYIGEVANALSAVTGAGNDGLRRQLLAIARRRTETADREFDEHGKLIKRSRKSDPLLDGSTVIIDRGVDGEPMDDSLFDGADAKIIGGGRRRPGKRTKRTKTRARKRRAS